MTLALCLLSGVCCAAEPMVVPFYVAFQAGPLDPVWTVNVSKGNTIALGDGALKISAFTNTYAHIQRPLGVDLVRVAGTLKSGGGMTWTNAIALYWDPGNWCKVGVLNGQNAVYTAESINNAYFEYPVPVPALGADWQYVAIELGEDCVRYQYSVDGKSWQSARVAMRSEYWKSKPPQLLIVGKGFTLVGVDSRLAAPDLKNDYSNRGPKTVSYVRDISVSRTAPGRLRITKAELEQCRPGRDKWGDEELAAATDPSFASVSRHFPAMSSPREVIGVKEAAEAIIIRPDGSLQFGTTSASFEVGAPPFRLGEGKSRWAKRLWEGYLPIVVATCEHDALKYEQTSLGWSFGMSVDAPLSAYVRLTISNSQADNRRIAVRLRVQQEKEKTARSAGSWALNLAAKDTQSVYIRIPFAAPATAAVVTASDYEARLAEAIACWKRLLSKGVRISVPERRVNDAYRAWLAYNFLNVKKRGNLYEPHDGSGFYDSVYGYSAVSYCHALDLMGYNEEAQTYLDSMAQLATPYGFGFGIVDNGALLLAMGEHYRLTADAAWLRRSVPTIMKLVDWMMQRRKESMSAGASDSPLYGLIKGRPYADHPEPAYCYLIDCYFVAGTTSVADALAAVGMAKEAERIRDESKAYAADILRSIRLTPVENDGLRILPLYPETRELLKSTSYVANGYYTIVAGMLLECGTIPGSGKSARLVTDFMERRGGLMLGMCALSGGIDHAYTYGYWLNCLDRDESKRVILGFYGSLAYGMTRETYAAVEYGSIKDGCNPDTLPDLYSNTQQLRLLRNMLLREQNGRLLIGQAIPRPWLEHGKQVKVENAPTAFGKTSFTVDSRVAEGRIVVTLDPPTRQSPAAIAIRLRHPRSEPMKMVSVGGVPCREFTADTITLHEARERVVVEARY